MGKKTYESKYPKYGPGVVACDKVVSTKYKEEATEFALECNKYMQNVEDANTYISRLTEKVDTSSADMLMQAICEATDKIKNSNTAVEERLTSIPNEINTKAEELDNDLTYYRIIETTNVESTTTTTNNTKPNKIMAAMKE